MYKELLNNIRHTTQQKMGKRLEQKLHQRRYVNNKQAHETPTPLVISKMQIKIRIEISLYTH